MDRLLAYLSLIYLPHSISLITEFFFPAFESTCNMCDMAPVWFRSKPIAVKQSQSVVSTLHLHIAYLKYGIHKVQFWDQHLPGSSVPLLTSVCFKFLLSKQSHLANVLLHTKVQRSGTHSVQHQQCFSYQTCQNCFKS